MKLANRFCENILHINVFINLNRWMLIAQRFYGILILSQITKLAKSVKPSIKRFIN